jgi:hypothetical protein
MSHFHPIYRQGFDSTPRAQSRKGLLPCLQIFDLGGSEPTLTNTLAYYKMELVTAVKSLILQAPGMKLDI